MGQDDAAMDILAMSVIAEVRELPVVSRRGQAGRQEASIGGDHHRRVYNAPRPAGGILSRVPQIPRTGDRVETE